QVWWPRSAVAIATAAARAQIAETCAQWTTVRPWPNAQPAGHWLLTRCLQLPLFLAKRIAGVGRPLRYKRAATEEREPPSAPVRIPPDKTYRQTDRHRRRFREGRCDQAPGAPRAGAPAPPVAGRLYG